MIKEAEAGGKKLVRLCEDWETAKLAERRKAEAEALAVHVHARRTSAAAGRPGRRRSLRPGAPARTIPRPARSSSSCRDELDLRRRRPRPRSRAATARRPRSRSTKRSPASRTSTRCSPSCAIGRRSTTACSSWRNAPWMPATRSRRHRRRKGETQVNAQTETKLPHADAGGAVTAIVPQSLEEMWRVSTWSCGPAWRRTL